VLTFELPRELSALVVEKGSVAVDGVSLTVSRLEADRFSVTVIPETRARTTLGEKRPGVRVNLETDIIGKHVARLLSGIAPGRLSRELLERCGFV
jgi:riboflavin synthase